MITELRHLASACYFLSFFFLSIDAEAKTEYSIRIENSLNKVKQSAVSQQPTPSSLNYIAEVKLARNEHESFQLVLSSKKNETKGVNIFVTNLVGKKQGNILKKENISVFLEQYIHISKFTDSPGWYPDALLPVKEFDIRSNTIQPLWITIYAPTDTVPDEYEGLMIIKASGAEDFIVFLEVTVWDFSLPRTPYLRTSFYIYWNFIAERHNIPKENGKLVEEMYREYMENALDHRINPTCLVSPDVIEGDGDISIDFKGFDKKMQHYLDLGLNSFAVFWHKFPPSFKKISSEPLKDKKITDRTKRILQLTERHLKGKEWLNFSYTYLVDEPQKEYFPQVKETFNFLKSCSPGIKRLLTLGPGASEGSLKPAYRELTGYVDIWAVATQFYDEKFLRERQGEGDEVWWYVYCDTRHPYANFWAIDYPGIDHRIIFWQAWRYNITGFLYWAADYWKVNVWEDPASFPGANGDGSLIYWSKEGPVNSIRWEIIRDGIEDYDYFCILRDASSKLQSMDTDKRYVHLIHRAKKILDVSDLTPSLTNYTKKPQELLSRREEIANLIVEINHAIDNESKI